ncbi:MAG: hypothetical protein ACI8QC_000572 [Planctomycetota bacterium]|jgi:hypothetical protein
MRFAVFSVTPMTLQPFHCGLPSFPTATGPEWGPSLVVYNPSKSEVTRTLLVDPRYSGLKGHGQVSTGTGHVRLPPQCAACARGLGGFFVSESPTTNRGDELRSRFKNIVMGKALVHPLEHGVPIPANQAHVLENRQHAAGGSSRTCR